MSTNINDSIKHITAMRARKHLYWMRIRGETIDDSVLKAAISRGVWRASNMRLLEWLMNELGVEQERALDLVTYAISNNFEDGGLYGL